MSEWHPMGDVDERSPSDFPPQRNKRPSSKLVARATATDIAMGEASTFLTHGRLCFGGLVILLAVRCIAWLSGSQPRRVVMFIHVVSMYADLTSTCFALPFVVLEHASWFLRHGLFGILMSVISAMIILDVGALVMVMYDLAPRPLENHVPSLFEIVQAAFGEWESIVVASVALQFTLNVCAFRTYREFRFAGVYPSHTKVSEEGEARSITVSPLEVVCESESVELLAEHELRIREAMGVDECMGSCEDDVKHPTNAE